MKRAPGGRRREQVERMEQIAPAHVDSPFRFHFIEPKKQPQHLLGLTDASVGYGDDVILDDINLDIERGGIVAFMGPSGAGKTTFFNCITGIYDPSGGDVLISAPKNGRTQRINGIKPNKVTEKGLARTFQNIRLFHNMTVLENVMIGCHCRMKAGILGAVLRGAATRREEESVIQKSYTILKKIGLEKYVNDFAKNLPYGAQRRLEIARAMCTRPALLCLDEPAAGLNPRESAALNELLLL